MGVEFEVAPGRRCALPWAALVKPRWATKSRQNRRECLAKCNAHDSQCFRLRRAEC